MESLSSKINEEYQLQLFGFSCKQLEFEIKLAISLYIKNLGNALLTTLMHGEIINQTHAKEILDSVQKCVEKRMIKLLPKLYSKFKTYFNIPAEVVLPENFKHELYKNKNLNEGKQTCKELENELAQLKYYREKLNNELLIFESIKSFLEEEMDLIDAVQEIMIHTERKSIENNQELMKKIKFLLTQY